MRMGNPSMRKILRNAESGEASSSFEKSTYGGITKKTFLYLGITVLAALLSGVLLQVSIERQDEAMLAVLLIGISVSAIPMLVISFVVAFVPSTVKVLGIIYSALQGVMLGVIVFFVDWMYPGIALAAVLATLIVFAVSLVLNKMLEVRVTNRIFRGLLIAFISIFAVELVLMIVSLFNTAMWESLFGMYLGLQLGISAFCVFYAAIMLMWDLQSAEQIVSYGADKKYEWQVAFSLSTTLVYMYIEILELLLRILMLFGNRNN